MIIALRPLCLGCLALAFAAAHISAQSPSPAPGPTSQDNIRTWLRSGDPRLQAWGAHYVLVTQDPNLLPDLVDLADRWRPLFRHAPDRALPTGLLPDQIDQRDAMAAVLDTLIQMNVSLSTNTVRALAADFGTPAAIFLSRMSPEQAIPLALELYRSSAPNRTPGLQYVSAAILAQHPLAGFAADLLNNTIVRATVLVITPGSKSGGSAFRGDCGVAQRIRRQDWPAFGEYSLENQTRQGALPVLEGIYPIYATRDQTHNDLSEGCGSTRVYLDTQERIRFIAGMLGITPEAIPWHATTGTVIEYQSPQQFDHAVLSFIEEQQALYRTTVAALVAQKLLTPPEAKESLPELYVIINDMRGRSNPFPAPSNLRAHVKWVVLR